MKAHTKLTAVRVSCLLLVTMSCAALFFGCRQKRPAAQTIDRSELNTIVNATGRADSLTQALDSDFGDRGYKFSVGFSSNETDLNSVNALLRGPSRLSVYGTKTFDEAIKLDQEIRERFDEQVLAGIEVLYELPTEWNRGQPVMYPAATLADTAEFYSEIKKRQQGTGQPATRTVFESEGSDQPQPESEEPSR